MRIQLSDHFTYSKLLRFTLPSIVMMVFTSIYGVVDGFFVSNYVGKTSFTAANFIYPVLIILGCAGFMLGAGGGALIAKTMGEGKGEEANRLFSLVIYVGIGCGAGGAGPGVHPPYRRRAGGPGADVGGQRGLCTDHPAGHPGVCPPV